MRQSREEKERSHERIVAAASARIRESGTVAPGIAEIMRSAGLTHGGFYKHFDSREDLIGEAVDRTFAENREAASSMSADAQDGLSSFLDWYVSTEHRDDPASGCGLVALGGDAPREDPRVRAAYTKQVKSYLTRLEQSRDDGDRDPRAEPTVMLSTLVGAVLLARAVDDPALSDAILADVRAVHSLGSGSPSADRLRRTSRG